MKISSIAIFFTVLLIMNGSSNVSLGTNITEEDNHECFSNISQLKENGLDDPNEPFWVIKTADTLECATQAFIEEGNEWNGQKLAPHYIRYKGEITNEILETIIRWLTIKEIRFFSITGNRRHPDYDCIYNWYMDRKEKNPNSGDEFLYKLIWLNLKSTLEEMAQGNNGLPEEWIENHRQYHLLKSHYKNYGGSKPLEQEFYLPLTKAKAFSENINQDSKAQSEEEHIVLPFEKLKLNQKDFTGAAPPSKYRNVKGNASFETGLPMLTDDFTKDVFSRLDYHSLKSVSQVNKHFRNLAIKCGWGAVKKAEVNSVSRLEEFLLASGFSPATDIAIIYNYPREGILKHTLPKPLEITPQQLAQIWRLLPSLKRISLKNISLEALGEIKHLENIPYAVLEAFSLSNNNLTSQGGNFLISQFPAFKKLTHLSIKYNNLKSLIQQLAKAISSMHYLTHIKLASLELEGHEIKDTLLPALKQLPDLRSINLDANNNNDAVAEGIADLIMNGRSSTLDEISFTHDMLNYHGASLTSKGIKTLQEAIFSSKNTIVQLNLLGHIFDEEGEKTIRQLQRKPGLNLEYTKKLKF